MMRVSMIVSVLCGIHALSGVATAQRDGVDATRYGWKSSLEAGKAEARSSGKPLMVVLRCVP